MHSKKTVVIKTIETRDGEVNNTRQTTKTHTSRLLKMFCSCLFVFDANWQETQFIFFTHVHSHGVRKHGCKSNTNVFSGKAAKMKLEKFASNSVLGWTTTFGYIWLKECFISGREWMMPLMNTPEWPHRQTSVCASTRAPWMSCPTWLEVCLARLPALLVQNRRVEASQKTVKLPVSRLCGAKNSQLRQHAVLHTVIKTHYRYFSGILLTLLSEYLQAEHTLDLTTWLI